MNSRNRVRTARAGSAAALLSGGMSLFGRLLGRGLHLGAMVVFARLLGPADFGIYALGWTILQVSGRIAPLGIDRALIKFGATGEPDQPLVRYCIALAAITGLATGVTISAAAGFLAEAFSKPELGPLLRVISIGIPLTVILTVGSSATLLRGTVKWAVIAEDVVVPAASFAGAVVVTLMGGGVLAAGVSTVVAVLAGAITASAALLRLSALRKIPSRHRPKLVQLLRFSLPAVLSAVLTMSILWIDRLLLGAIAAPEQLGIYYAAASISIVPTLVLGSFDRVLRPLFSRHANAGEYHIVGRYYVVSARWVTGLTWPVAIALLALAPSAMTAFYGPEYSVGANTLRLLSLAHMVAATIGSVGLLLNMAGEQDSWMHASIWWFLIATTLNLVLIPEWGRDGAALSTLMSLTGVYVTGMIFIASRLGIYRFAAVPVPTVLASLAALAAVFATRSLVGGATLSLALGVGVSVITYWAILAIVGRWTWVALRSLHLPRDLQFLEDESAAPDAFR